MAGRFFTTDPPGRPKWLCSLFNSYLKIPVLLQNNCGEETTHRESTLFVFFFFFLKKSVLHVSKVSISVKIITGNLLTSLTRKEQGTDEGHITDEKLKFYFLSAGLVEQWIMCPTTE